MMFTSDIYGDGWGCVLQVGYIFSNITLLFFKFLLERFLFFLSCYYFSRYREHLIPYQVLVGLKHFSPQFFLQLEHF